MLKEITKSPSSCDRLGKKIQIALSNSSEERVDRALANQKIYTAKARQLKTLVERHTMHISTLETQLAFWENQLLT
ncbi:hypothetical protein [Nostoc sp. LPT]|uniref:hypothetical protein n=1 Tax=Nostoc sp. LPT TaxID=2815387 RepID=UPI001D918393|nr:hypothetical protein [Nostoc sp. LPT]MBN4006697.1 hypothetical protein [Nostoc sp. LPT]